MRGAGWVRPTVASVTGPGRPVLALALATGLAQGAWMLRQLAVTVPGLAATTQPRSWRHGAAQLLLAEAFITASGKPDPAASGPACR
jgi:hypothetical protein